LLDKKKFQHTDTRDHAAIDDGEDSGDGEDRERTPLMVHVAIDTDSALGPTSAALGPHMVSVIDAQHLCCKTSFKSATIYHPEGGGSQLPSVVIVGGWACGEHALAAWAPFYASHGIVAMTIGTAQPWKDQPPDLSRALLDASAALQLEHERAGSALHGRMDVTRRAVQGYSLGGGGAQLAALEDKTLKCVIALCPHEGVPPTHPAELSASVPVLIIAGEKDKSADGQKQAWPQYRKTRADKLLFEIAGADHFVANGPAGGIEKDISRGTRCALCNFCCAICCRSLKCCGCVLCPWDVLDGPSGHARDQAPHGAVGGVALAWLRLYLLGDETARSQLAVRPGIASSFESEGVGAAMAIERS
jgi:dienelactone hydrolase